MAKPSNFKVIVLFISLIASVTVLSIVSVNQWADKKEEVPHQDVAVQYQEGMTVGEFGQANGLERKQLKELFGLASPSDLNRPVSDFGMDKDAISGKLQKSGAVSAEYESKNWVKIPLKFATWFAFLGAIFVLMRAGRITGALRKRLYLLAVLIFGIILSADPSPMGTVKDAIHLYGATGAIFPPRMIALTLFLLIVLVANKYICGWGCQFGVLQDAIFRLNRNKRDSSGVMKQYKIPFVVSNSIRVLFLAVFTLAAFAWGADIMELYDPFKIFKPLVLGTVGIVVIGALLIAALFVYRPWCTLFCPFGLVGWLVEKISLFNIHVDYNSCIACQACAKACPSTVMEAILKREKKVIPDCFACATCMGVCPVDAISFKTGKRQLPPEGKFDRKEVPESARKAAGEEQADAES